MTTDVINGTDTTPIDDSTVTVADVAEQDELLEEELLVEEVSIDGMCGVY